MSRSLDSIRGASLPAAALATLADLRRDADLSVVTEPVPDLLAEAGMGQRVWLRWQAEDEARVLRLMFVPGVELYDRRDGAWYRHGCHVPAFGVPLDSVDAKAIDRAIVPLPVQPREPDQSVPAPARLELVRDERYRPPSALRCEIEMLACWVETVTTARIKALSAARVGDTVIVLGARLPEIASDNRFWGGRALVPLGFRPEPDLPEVALRGAMKAQADELLILDESGCELLPLDVFRPLSRAAVRLALEERAR
jgi:hypothetical protein